MAVPQGVSIVLYAATRRQRFALFLSKNQLLFLSLHLFSQLLFVGAVGGVRGGLARKASSVALGDKTPKQIVHKAEVKQ